MKQVIIVQIVSFILAVTAVSSACSDDDVGTRRPFDSLLQSVPLPSWWNEISVDHKKIESVEKMQVFLTEEHRAHERRIAKVAYQAALDHPQNYELLFFSVNIFANKLDDQQEKRLLLERAIEKYLDDPTMFTKRTQRIANSVGDMIFRLTGKYNTESQFQKSVDLINKFLGVSAEKCSDELLELVAMRKATALYGLGKKQDAVNVLQKAVIEYKGSWKANLKNQLQKCQEGDSCPSWF